LALELTVEEIDRWPETMAKVTLDDVKRAAAKHLDMRHSVTGTLVPVSAEPHRVAAPKPGAGTADVPAAAGKSDQGTR
jgi:zinc protease